MSRPMKLTVSGYQMDVTDDVERNRDAILAAIEEDGRRTSSWPRRDR